MSTINLIILGMLKDGPQNAYEINKTLINRNIQHWVKISPQGVYRNVLQLNEKGYITGKSVKEGKNPEKTIYSITSKGQRHFLNLMKKYSKDIGNAYFDFNTVIVNLTRVNRVLGETLIDSIYKQMQERKKIIEYNLQSRKKNIPAEGLAVIEQYNILYKNLIHWMEGFKKEYISK